MLHLPCSLEIVRFTVQGGIGNVAGLLQSEDIDGLLSADPFVSLKLVRLTLLYGCPLEPGTEDKQRRRIEACLPRCRERGILDVEVQVKGGISLSRCLFDLIEH